jgi:hypothetical protein
MPKIPRGEGEGVVGKESREKQKISTTADAFGMTTKKCKGENKSKGGSSARQG